MSASAITSSMHKTWPSAGSPKTAKFLSKSKGHRLQNGYLRYRIVTLSRGTIVDHCHHYKDVLIDIEVWTLPWLVVCSNRAVGEGGSRLCACASLGDRSAPSGWTSRVTSFPFFFLGLDPGMGPEWALLLNWTSDLLGSIRQTMGNVGAP